MAGSIPRISHGKQHQAAYLISAQPWDFAFGKGSLLERFLELGGRILLLGRDHDAVTFLHYVEHIADFPNKRIMRFKVPAQRNRERVWLDMQEVDNAVNQAAKEIGTRFDFRGVGATIAWSGEHAVDIRANSEERAKAVLDVFKDKLVKRGVSLKTLDPGDPKPSGKEYRMSVTLKEGITQDNAKKISKIIRDEGPRGVRAQVQGEELRVSAKKKDDLQAVIALLKGKEFDFALQFVNYR